MNNFEQLLNSENESVKSFASTVKQNFKDRLEVVMWLEG